MELGLELERLIAGGEHFLSFSASASTSVDAYEEDEGVYIVGLDSRPSHLANPTTPKPSPDKRLIIKLGYLLNRPHHLSHHLPSAVDIAFAIENEVRILSGPLTDLQGTVVPRLHGLWRSEDGDWAMVVMEDVGDGTGALRMNEGLSEVRR